MASKKVHSIIILCLFILFLFSSCSNRTIDLSYIKKPEKIVVGNSTYTNEVKDLLDKLKSTDDIEKKQELEKKLEEYSDLAFIETADTVFIDKIYDELTKSKGKISKKIDTDIYKKSVYSLQFDYGMDTTLEMIKEGYIPSIIVFNNGIVLIPKYDEGSKTKLINIESKISSDTYDHIDSITDTKGS